MTNEAEWVSFAAWEAVLKRVIHQMKKQEGIQTGHAYEKLARQNGFNTYAAWRAHMKEKLK